MSVLKIILSLQYNLLADMKTMKVRQILSMLHADGWYLCATRGDHRQFKHDTKKGKVTVAGKPNDDIDGLVLQSILKQAGLK